MNKKSRRKAARNLADSVTAFYPELADTFICPTCLCHIPLTRLREITAAHIIPKAAGGRKESLLCHRCNSTFGANQDRWFGDYLRAMDSDAGALSAPQAGYLEIDGIRAAGKCSIRPDGGLDFVVDFDRMSPENVRKIEASRNRQDELTISVPIPLLGKMDEVDVGFLTSAYLLWFDAAGYSFALQSHLQLVRDQIQDPGSGVLRGLFHFQLEQHRFEAPWIGVAVVSGELAVAAGIANRLVVFPPRDKVRLYSVLEDFERGVLERYGGLALAEEHRRSTPLGIAYEDRLLIEPDVMASGEAPSRILFFPGENEAGVLLEPTSRERADELRGQPDTKRVSIRRRIEVSKGQAGRQA